MNFRRLGQIVLNGMSGAEGTNINGPSLMEVPDWIDKNLGRYYLYFAHHHGSYIRLAYANDIEGPWTIYSGGVLHLDSSHFDGHVASPDIHIIPELQQVRLYYHGAYRDSHRQATRVAISRDGLNFKSLAAELGDPYFRAFRWKRHWYAIAALGKLSRSESGLEGFSQGSRLLTESVRHTAVWRSDSKMFVFYTNCGDTPERILVSTVDLDQDWTLWRPSPPLVVLEPETEYEGVKYPLHPSTRGASYEPVRQLRDPAVFEDEETLYLVYSTAGESGLALASIAKCELLSWAR